MDGVMVAEMDDELQELNADGCQSWTMWSGTATPVPKNAKGFKADWSLMAAVPNAMMLKWMGTGRMRG